MLQFLWIGVVVNLYHFFLYVCFFFTAGGDGLCSAVLTVAVEGSRWRFHYDDVIVKESNGGVFGTVGLMLGWCM